MSETINLSPLNTTDEDKKLSDLSPETPVEEPSQEKKAPVATSAQVEQLELADSVVDSENARQDDIKVIQEKMAADTQVEQTVTQAEGPEDSESFLSSLATSIMQTPPVVAATKLAVDTIQTRALFEEDRGGVLSPKFFKDGQPTMAAEQVLKSFYSVGDEALDRAFYGIITHPRTLGVLTVRNSDGTIIPETIRKDGKINPAAALQIANKRYDESKDGSTSNFIDFTGEDDDRRFALLGASKAKVVVIQGTRDDKDAVYTTIPGYGPGYYLFSNTTDVARNAYLRGFIDPDGNESTSTLDERTQNISDNLIDTSGRYAELLDEVPDVTDANRILAIAARGARGATETGVGIQSFAAGLFNSAVSIAAGIAKAEMGAAGMTAEALARNPDASAAARLSTRMYMDAVDDTSEDFKIETIPEQFAQEAQIPVELAERIFAYDETFRERAVKLFPEVATFYGIFKSVGTKSTKKAYEEFQDFVRKQPEFLNDSDDVIISKFQNQDGLYDTILARHVDERMGRRSLNPLNFFRSAGQRREEIEKKIGRGFRFTEEGLAEIEEQSSKRVASLLEEAQDIEDQLQIIAPQFGRPALTASERFVLNTKKLNLTGKASYEKVFGVPFTKFDDLGSEVVSFGGAIAAISVVENYFIEPDFDATTFLVTRSGSEIGGAVLAPILFETVKRPFSATALNAAIDIADLAMSAMISGKTDKIKFKDVFAKTDTQSETYKQALSIYDTIFEGLSASERNALLSEGSDATAFIDDIMDIKDPLTGLAAFERSDLELTLGAALNSPVLNSLYQATLGVVDIKDQYDLGKSLSTQSELINRQQVTRDKMQKVLTSIVNPEENLSPEGLRMFKMLEKGLAQQEVAIERQLESFNKSRETYFNVLKETIGINETRKIEPTGVPSSKKAFEAFERDFRVDALGDDGLPDIEKVRLFNAQLLQLQQAAQENWDNQLKLFRSGQNAYGDDSIETFLFDYHAGLKVADRTAYKEAYALVDDKHSDVYVDGFNLLNRIKSGRAYEYMTSDELYDVSTDGLELINTPTGDAASVLVNKIGVSKSVPQERQYMALMEAAAHRFFVQRAGQQAGNNMRKNIVDAFVDLPEEVREAYPLQSSRNIDVWEWQKKYFAEESFDNVPDELKSLFGFTDQAQMRNYADSMQLPLNFSELNTLDSVVGRGRFKAGQTGATELERVMGGIQESIRLERSQGLRSRTTGDFIDDARRDEIETDIAAADTKFKIYQKRHSSRDTSNKGGKNPLVKAQEDGIQAEYMTDVLKKMGETTSPQKFFERQEGRNLVKLFGEWDEATGQFYLIEGSKGAEDLKELMRNSFLSHMLGTAGGKYVTSFAKLDPSKQSLGVFTTYDGIVQLDDVAGDMLQRTVIENPVKTMRAMEAIPTYTRNADGVMESAGSLFKETDEYFPIGRYENIENVPIFSQQLGESVKYLDEITKESEDYINTYVKIYRNHAKKLQQEIGKSGNFEEIIYEQATTDTGRVVLSGFREALPEAEREAFDLLINKSVRRGTYRKLQVTDGEGIDILKLDKLFSDDRALEALRETSPNIVKSLESIKKFTDRVYPPDHPLRLTGKPLPFNIESGFNKLWQVMRHQASFRWLALEAIFRTGRKKKYDAFVTMLGDPEITETFLKILEDGVQPKTAKMNRALERFNRAMTRNVVINAELNREGITEREVERREEAGERGFRFAPQQDAIYGGPKNMIERLDHINKMNTVAPMGVIQ